MIQLHGLTGGGVCSFGLVEHKRRHKWKIRFDMDQKHVKFEYSCKQQCCGSNAKYWILVTKNVSFELHFRDLAKRLPLWKPACGPALMHHRRTPRGRSVNLCCESGPDLKNLIHMSMTARQTRVFKVSYHYTPNRDYILLPASVCSACSTHGMISRTYSLAKIRLS